VIASYTDMGELTQPLNALVRLGTIAHHIAKAPNLVEMANISQNGLKSSQIGVDVGQN
jgi:hypothetical protein